MKNEPQNVMRNVTRDVTRDVMIDSIRYVIKQSTGTED